MVITNRKAFEAWMRKIHPTENLEKCSIKDGFIYAHGQYMNTRIQDAWIGYQAGRIDLASQMSESLEREYWSEYAGLDEARAILLVASEMEPRP